MADEQTEHQKSRSNYVNSSERIFFMRHLSEQYGLIGLIGNDHRDGED